MSSGPTYPKITLTAHEFIPSNEEVLLLQYISSENRLGGRPGNLKDTYSPPLALRDVEIDGLIEMCQCHIDSIIDENRNPLEFIIGDASVIVWQIYDIVNHYRRSSNSDEQKRKLVSINCKHIAKLLYSRTLSYGKLQSYKLCIIS
jgi:hypothetical protein